MESFEISEIQSHNKLDDAWIILDGSVYDISDYLEDESHPGGIILLQEHLGSDISHIFTDEKIHEHSSDAFKLLEFYKIGIVRK
jgi:cytochrome b involved in lipid metabolism